ncbi:MAG: CheB methylesterase domain-containing protein, partial [Candidatus Latescibacterota bacterium]
KITVEEARDGILAEAGKMYLAPGGRHLRVHRAGERAVLSISDSPPVNNCQPSVDVLFRSMAATYGGNILAVILTGMGKDGVAGVAAIRRKGGYCIVQDEATSVVWGMPQAVIDSRDADEVLPVDEIARRITEIVNENRG